MEHATWYRIGRWTAWINAFALIAGAVLFVPWLGGLAGAQEGLAPAAAAAARFTHTYESLGQVFGFQLFFLMAWWTFIPISLVLQKRLGSGPASQLLPWVIFAGAILGSVTQFLDLAITAAARTLAPAVATDALPTIALTYIPLRAGGAWCLSGAFFLLGVGYLLAARRALTIVEMPRLWAYFTFLAGLVALLSLIASVANVPLLNQLSLLGVILGSALWSAWTGWLFRKS